MRIALIQPPVRDFYRTRERTEPLGLEYVAASAREAGHEVVIVDAMSFDSGGKSAPLPPELHHMAVFYPVGDLSPFRLFSAFRHFGASFEEIAEQVERFDPQLVGVSANFTPYMNESLTCVREIKRRLPCVRTVLGGHHATACPRTLLANAAVDFVIRGEGERSLCELAAALEADGDLSTVPGLVFRGPRGQILENPMATPIEPLDSLPMPLAPPRSTRVVLTSRGCPRQCSFCSIALVMGNRLRLRDPRKVLDEIEAAVQRGARAIDFEDDNMNWEPDHMVRILDGLVTRFADRGIRFSAMNGLVAEKLNDGILERMRAAGFEQLNLAIVAGSAAEQHRLRRGQPVETFERTVLAARRCGLQTTAYLILGLPDDSLESMIGDVLWLARLPVRIGPSVFYPVPGTPLYDLCVARGHIRAEAATELRSSAYPVETENFSRPDLVTLMRLCRLINYMKECRAPAAGQRTAPHLDTKAPAPTDAAAIPLPPSQRLARIESSVHLSREEIGDHLVRRFLVDGLLLGLRCRRKRTLPCLYEEMGLATSQKVIDAVRDALRKDPVAPC